MKIDFQKEASGVVTARFDGSLDYQASAQLRGGLNQFLQETPPRILMDLTGVTYVDSSGIAFFVELSQKVKAAGGKMVFAGLNDSVRSVFELAKLHLFFTIAPTRENALNTLNG